MRVKHEVETFDGPDKFDLEKVAQLIDQAAAAKPDGLMLTVTDADLFRAPIERRPARLHGATSDLHDLGSPLNRRNAW